MYTACQRERNNQGVYTACERGRDDQGVYSQPVRGKETTKGCTHSLSEGKRRPRGVLTACQRGRDDQEVYLQPVFLQQDSGLPGADEHAAGQRSKPQQQKDPGDERAARHIAQTPQEPLAAVVAPVCNTHDHQHVNMLLQVLIDR